MAFYLSSLDETEYSIDEHIYITDQILKACLWFIFLMIKMKVFLTVKPVFVILYQINFTTEIKYLLAQCAKGKNKCAWPVKLMPVTKEGCHAPVRTSACYRLRAEMCWDRCVCDIGNRGALQLSVMPKKTPKFVNFCLIIWAFKS